MKQLTQKLGSGEMRTQDVPLPQVGPGCVSVRNHFSLISPGTEGSTVKAARKNLIGKAKERPDQLRQVADALKRVGPVQTYRAVMKKLDAYSPLGYSCAGEVMDVGEGVTEFRVGDRVACAGINASHAEVIAVPVNLCVRLADDAQLKNACYNALGAIAMQGVRQADLRLGESCVVIGLGLIGQLTCLLLQASGIRVFGVDIHEAMVKLARQHCVLRAWTRGQTSIHDELLRETNGLGADAVIITATATSLDPINFAGKLSRKRGRVVVIGAVPTGFDREPDYYRKELELRMSCSYGPGRYDLDYEEHGHDYPAAYVRWTQNRNMQAFQDLIYRGAADLDYLTTHEFGVEQAADAFNLIVDRTEPFLGIVLRYNVATPIDTSPVVTGSSKPTSKVGIAFVGAGSYAQGNLLPYLPTNDTAIALRSVLTRSGTTSKRVAEKFGFENCVSHLSDILGNSNVNTLFVATRHDSHCQYVVEGLQAGKHVFVEKPLALNRHELDRIDEAVASHPTCQLMVGFNRRFSPLATQLRSVLTDAPMSMIYRINAGSMPASSWVQDPKIGGGRIVGEACHFIDLMSYLARALPTAVYAAAVPAPGGFNDTVSIHLQFENGSIGTVHYFANGSQQVPKEYLEVSQSGVTGILNDFKSLVVHGHRSPIRKKQLNQDKGQRAMMGAFLQAVQTGATLIPYEAVRRTTAATFATLESLSRSNVQTVDLVDGR